MKRTVNADSPLLPALSDENAWHFEVRPNLWLAGINGRLRVQNSTAETGNNSSDILGMLDFAAAAEIEAKNGRWSLMFDENYVNLLGGEGSPIFACDLNPRTPLRLKAVETSWVFSSAIDSK